MGFNIGRGLLGGTAAGADAYSLQMKEQSAREYEDLKAKTLYQQRVSLEGMRNTNAKALQTQAAKDAEGLASHKAGLLEGAEVIGYNKQGQPVRKGDNVVPDMSVAEYQRQQKVKDLETSEQVKREQGAVTTLWNRNVSATDAFDASGLPPEKKEAFIIEHINKQIASEQGGVSISESVKLEAMKQSASALKDLKMDEDAYEAEAKAIQTKTGKMSPAEIDAAIRANAYQSFVSQGATRTGVDMSDFGLDEKEAAYVEKLGAEYNEKKTDAERRTFLKRLKATSPNAFAKLGIEIPEATGGKEGGQGFQGLPTLFMDILKVPGKASSFMFDPATGTIPKAANWLLSGSYSTPFEREAQ